MVHQKPGRFLDPVAPLLLASLALFLGPTMLWSAPSPLPEASPGMRFGMEVELTAPRLAPLMDHFDLGPSSNQIIQRLTKEFSGGFFDDYLESKPANLESLPKELRDKLTAGLDLSTPSLERAPRPRIESERAPLIRPGLLDANGRALGPSAARPSLITPPSAPLQVPSPLKEALPPGGLILPEGSAWQMVLRRWRELPFETKRGVARWEGLSHQRRAELAISNDEQLRLSQTAPPSWKELFSRLQWSQDGSALEFRHREDIKITSWQNLWDDIMELGKLTGTESFLRDPANSKIRGLSLHYHVSRANEDFAARAEALNTLFFFRRLNQGIMTDLSQEEAYRYRPQTGSRGLIRLFPPHDRMEFRMREWPLSEEMNLVQRVLGTSAEAGLSLARNEIHSLIDSNPDILIRLSQGDEHTQSSVFGFLSPEQKVLLEQHNRNIHQRLRAIYDTGPMGQLRATRILKNLDFLPDDMVPIIRSQLDPSKIRISEDLSDVLDLIQNKRSIPLELWKVLYKFIDGTFANGDGAKIRAFEFQVNRIYSSPFTANAPPEVRDFMARSLMNRPNFTLGTLLNLAEKQKSWPPYILETLLAFDREDRLKNRYVIENHLLEIIRASVHLEDPHPFLQDVALRLIRSSSVPKERKWAMLWQFARGQRNLNPELIEALKRGPEEFRPHDHQYLLEHAASGRGTCARVFAALDR